MKANSLPDTIPNWINGQECAAIAQETFDKLSPDTGRKLYLVARSGLQDVQNAIQAARLAQADWAERTPVERGDILHNIAQAMRKHQKEISEIVAMETGMSFSAAMGETGGAIAQGEFASGEGRRFYGRTTTSGVPNKYAMTVRQPLGVAALIIAANTPIANVAWKVFPALICGNAAVLKAAEDTPATAWYFAQIAHEAGLPPGVLNVIQGYGQEAGAPLVADPDVDVVSFTGSTAVGRQIASIAGQRLAKVSLELGGKNALVVCDDADLASAAKWVLLSAFSNAGQRCASGSRIIIFDAVYDQFRDMLIQQTHALSVGPGDDNDLGPVINEKQLNNMLAAIQKAQENGAVVLTGGHRLTDDAHKGGFYMAPTLIENADVKSDISTSELFGPITCLYRVGDFHEAMKMANDSPYGLTACIHTRNFHRAMEFCRKIQTGVAVVNAGTFGSEPHMPFGGLKQSGNGTREPGTEALDVYSDLKNIIINIDPEKL